MDTIQETHQKRYTLGELAESIQLSNKTRETVDIPDDWDFTFDEDVKKSTFSFNNTDYKCESPEAQKSVLKYLKIPYNFIKGVDEELASYTVTSLRADCKASLSARVDNVEGTLIGVHSSRVEPLPDDVVLEMFLDSFGDDVEVFGGRQKDNSSLMNFSILSQEVEKVADLPDGNPDLFRFLTKVSLSEIAKIQLAADIGAYRVVCANGMVTRLSGSKYLQMSYARMDTNTLRTRIQAIADQSEITLVGMASALKKSLGIEVGQPRVGGVLSEKFSRELKKLLSVRRLNAKFAEDVADKMEQSMLEPTAYSLVQAVTQHAQTFPDGRRNDLEAAAGYYISALDEAA